MKHGKWILLMALIFCANGNGQDNMYVKIVKENIRSAPGGDKIGEIMSGSKVKVVERNGSWAKVQITGWIWEKSLTSDPSRVDGFKVRASHILLKTEAEANAVLNELKGGASFEETAKTKSVDLASGKNGGDLGEFGHGDLMPAFENVVLGLGIGKISGVVKTDLGYHIIKRTK